MRLARYYIFFAWACMSGCSHQSDFRDEKSIITSDGVAVAEMMPTPTNNFIDSMFIEQHSVVFYAPKMEELNTLIRDKSTRDGVARAVGDLAYYASIVSDSLEVAQIPVHFTNKRYLIFINDAGQFVIDRHESDSPLGLIIFDENGPPLVVPGMQTHLSLLTTISDHFYNEPIELIPFLDYFEEADSRSLHIYSSHSEILNQTGNRVDPSHYSKLGAYIAARAAKYQMSVFGYQKFILQDSVYAIICRVPSLYDESAIRLYLYDAQVAEVIDEIELAENVWNEQWIMVKDSWITIVPEGGTFSIVQRKKEARIENGKRTENDSLYHWKWNRSGFKIAVTSGLSRSDYPLKDWESYQESTAPTEINFIDENHVWLPLTTGDLTWENLIMELPKPYRIEKQPIENKLANDQIDTLITISRPDVKLTFYRSPEDNLLVDGVISDRSVEFKNRIRVGMAKDDFIENFEHLSAKAVVPDLIKVSSTNSDRVLSYFFKNDTLTCIEVTNFIH
jgi:hypothetical protein